MRRFLHKILLTWSLWLPLIVTGQNLSGEIVSINEAGCQAPFNGNITVAAIDGTAPYTYTLDGTLAQSSGYFANIDLGDHSILIEDSSGDLFTIDFTMGINNSLLINIIDLSNLVCFGDEDGSVSVVASSGVSPFQFSIDSGLTFQATGLFTDLSAGDYQIIAQDAAGCQDTVYASIVALSHINILSLNKVNVACNGDSTGSVQLLGELGTSPYSYSPDGSNYFSNGFFSNINAGIHQFWIEDLNGCQDSIILNFSQPQALLMENFSTTSPLCFNGLNGTIDFEASGGALPYSFQLDGAVISNTPSFTNLAAEQHLIQMSDNNGCTIDTLIGISEPDSLYFNVVNSIQPQCNGLSDGSITISGQGGIPPYVYKMGTGPWLASGLFSGLSAANYSFKVKDQNGCVFTKVITLNEPAPISLSLNNQNNVYCNISTNGLIDVSASGGISPYSYALNGNTAQATGLFTSLSSGSYSVVVLDDHLCSDSLSIDIIETTSLSIDDIAVQAAVCGSSSNGELTVQVSGGLSPYQYAIDGSLPQASNVFTNVGIGLHDITVYASDGCSVSDQQFLGEASPLIGTVLSHVDPICEGGLNGSLSILASGGTGPYSYSFDGGSTWQASGLFTGISDSTYLFRIIDQNFCSFDTLITFEEQSSLSMSIFYISPAICPNSASGSITVFGQDGVLPYSYSKDGSTFTTSNFFNSLNPGDHTIYLKDANACIVDSVFTIDALGTPAVNIDSLIPPTCNGQSDGVIMLSPDGGATPYLYALNPGPLSSNNYFNGLSAGSYTVDLQDNNGCTSSIDLTLTDIPVFSVAIDSIKHVQCKNAEEGFFYYSFTGGLAPYSIRINNGSWQNAGNSFGPLFAGIYNLDFKDSNGCIVSLTEQINQPATAVNTQILSVVNVQCVSDSSASVLGYASGGISPYQFSLDNINFQSSGSFTNLPVGDYILYAQDSNGCESSESFSVIANSPILLSWNNVIAPSCESVNNGQIQVNVSSPTSPPFTYTINNGVGQSSSLFSNLGADYYLIEVEDQNGCKATIDTLLNSFSDLAISLDSTQNIFCVADSSGSIYLSASGGSPSYSFFVNGNALTGNSLGNLYSGVYQTWVVDAVGCTDSMEVAVLQESLLQGSIFSQQNILCNNGDLGSVTINGSTGTSPYQYAIDGVNFSTQNTFTDLEEGNYVISIKDASNCETDVNVTIELLVELNVQSQTIVQPTCFGLNDGSISLSVSNGIGPYSYALNNNSFSANSDFNNLGAGDYTLYAMDSQGCHDSIELALTDPLALSFVLDSISMASCYGAEDGMIDVVGVNTIGSSVYSIQGQTNANNDGLFLDLGANSYTIQITDANGCSADSVFTVSAPSAMSLTYELVNPLHCYGDEDAIIEAAATGGSAPYTFFIDGQSNGTNPFINNLAAGSHDLMVRDQNNCQASISFEIDSPDSLYLQYFVKNNVTCYGLTNGSVFFLAAGGSGDLSYTLNSTAVSSGLHPNLAGGIYTLSISDTMFCELNLDFEIVEPDSLVIDSVLIQLPSCVGSSDASISISVSGGTEPYNYSISSVGNSADSVFNDLDEGYYYISITDFKGCNVSQFEYVANPELFELGLSALNPPLCHGDSTARVVLQTDGGNGFEVYGLSWDMMDSSYIFNQLAAGLTTFYSLDGLGCKDSLTVYIPPTDSITLNASIIEPTCYGSNDASVQFSSVGGSGAFQYALDNGPWLNQNAFTNLTAGNYIFRIKDSNLCIKDSTLIIDQPDSLYASIAFVHPVTCSDPNSGSLDILINGGTSPYTSTLNGDSFSGSSVTFTDLAIGYYQIQIVDEHDCFTSLNASILEVDSVVASVDPVTLACYGYNNGVATVDYSGGSGDYVITWDNSTSDQTPSTQPNLVAGVTYTVIVRDSLDLDCYATAQVTPTQPEEIQFELFAFSASCDPNDISVSVELLSGGVGDILYAINNQAPVNSGIFSNLNAVSTAFRVIDETGCIKTRWMVPENPNSIDAYFEVSDDIVSMANGFVVFTDLTPNAEYLKWDFGDNTIVEGMTGDQAIGNETSGTMLQPTHNYANFGQYNAKLSVTSNFGCEDDYEKTIIVKEDHRIYIPNSFTPNGDGINDIFKVEGITVQEKKFSLTIYDRRGLVVFESFDIHKGWDGLDTHGIEATPDVYVFVVNYYSGDKYFEKNGTVTLLR